MIINLGLPKSGTTTLGEALRSAGLRVADHKVRGGDGAPPEVTGGPIARHLYDGYFHDGDPLARLGFYDALTEISILRPNLSLWPQTDFGLLQTVRDLHPDARFVLSWRPAEDIADSMRRWRNLGRERLPRNPVPGLPAGYGYEPLDLIRFIEGHHAFVARIFQDDPKFLWLDVGAPDAQAALARFIGRPVPWWGRANANPATDTA